ncbi:hypothetical protein OOZ15_18920 [Galbibacter sp. EGI 63066]|uniref:toxin-antitoxin system YwqK family antitoxin n=1 Tax=Galbibacter sp. EGI 63066 TaxID=2993559 RepID=UPI002248FBCD|nr:hypothetical protein [Galbibacter sp. EGI 63066]MCX2682032.1 hypothetical protein [Galbibacter sp. EGI 63066]
MNKTDNIQEEDLLQKDEVAYKEGKPFTGIAVQDWTFLANPGFNEWANYTAYTPYKNGIKEGVCRAYYENNQLRYEVVYKNGLRNGRFISWFENGKLSEEGFYENGKKVGIWKTWFKNECMESEMNFENDKELDVKRWFDNYQLKSERKEKGIFEDDEIKVTERGYYRNGLLKYEKKIIKKNNSVICIEWHKNGQLMKEEVINDDNGQYLLYLFERAFYENNIVKSETNYKIGYKKEKKHVVGETKARIFRFPIKINHGVHRFWYEEGKLNKEFFYINGKKDGIANEWDSKGNLICNQIYKNGKLLEEKRMFEDYIERVFFRIENGFKKRVLEYRKYDGQLLPKSEWPKLKIKHYDSSYDNGFNDAYYNDQLDMDQQSPEFWDSQ